MLLNEITTSEDRKIQKINKVLKETYGFTLVSEIKTGTLNTLYTKISDDLYDLKLDLSTVKDSAYMQKVLVLEGLKILITKNNRRLEEQAVLAGKGGRAFTRILDELTKFVEKVCNMGDDYEEAIKDAMKHYRSSIYRFSDDLVEYELRKATESDCTDTMLGEVYESTECTDCDGTGLNKAGDGDCKTCANITEDTECDVCVDCKCDPCKCEKEEIDEDHQVITLADIEAHGGPITGTNIKGGPGTTTRHDATDQVTVSKQRRAVDFSKWREFDPKEIMSQVYWQKNQLPPSDPEAWERNWAKVKTNLEARYPESELEEDGDRHAEREWVKGIKKERGIDDEPGYYDPDAGDLSLSLEDPDEQQDDADDYFSYRSKQKRTEMKEGYVKELRKLLEAETDQAESLIAAKSFSQELQDMVEKLGRLVNENLPAVSEQMRDAYGSDVATGFEDQVSGTLNSVMDSLRQSKQEIDNSVSTIADGGAPMAGNDMESYSDEELGGEFDDAELELDGDVELDLGDDELGDEFGGDDAMAGLEDEPLGRAKKEALIVIGKKLVETKAKLARIKARK